MVHWSVHPQIPAIFTMKMNSMHQSVIDIIYTRTYVMTMRKKICLLTVVEIYLDEFILEQEFVSVKYLLMDARSFQVQDMFQFVVEMKSM